MIVGAGRRLVLIRHAQAERETAVDKERRLDARGREEASRAGRWLAGSGVTPDLVRVSGARRTTETWERVGTALPRLPVAVHEPGLYDLSVEIHRGEAGIGELVAMVRGSSDDVGDLVVVGHNPSLPGLVRLLVGTAGGDLSRLVEESGFPTASIAVLEFDGSWQGIGPGTARITAFWTPSQG
ncbi:histidine phosphatase family protein [Kitasatospora sp. CB02891]|uniref:SixA phosphatase family protein n=1 Tax=Kitasatospora sp. CB02891 TaxID=2020329 RepID=UPI000C28016F|nr:histidine phosphatase family protein [Kitasatospora sp. CB02891]PJN28115.1 phosphohistidine phosphatase [Kitasatospora sp. CB02891]